MRNSAPGTCVVESLLNPILKKNEKLVSYLLGLYHGDKLAKNPELWEEAFQTGMLALWDGLLSYDGKTKQGYYLSVCINRRLKDYWRGIGRYRERFQQWKDRTDIPTSIRSDGNPCDDTELRALDQTIQTLSHRERVIWEMLVNGYNHDEIGERVGMTAKQVTRWKGRLVNEIRNISRNLAKS